MVTKEYTTRGLGFRDKALGFRTRGVGFRQNLTKPSHLKMHHQLRSQEVSNMNATLQDETLNPKPLSLNPEPCTLN